MDKKLLKEELERIHTLTYGKKVTLDEGIVDDILNFFGLGKNKKKDEPTKADLLQGTYNDLISTLKSIKSPIEQGEKGKQKEIEAVQVALVLAMDKNPLPKSGVDGTFGPETAEAVKNFKEENNLSVTKNSEETQIDKKQNDKQEDINEGLRDWFSKLLDRISGDETEKETITPEFIKKLLSKLKSKKIADKDVEKYTDSSGKLNIVTRGNWVDITKQLLRRFESFSPTAKWDENAYRGGYGTDKKLIDDKLVDATKETTWSKQEAEDTMDYEIINSYSPPIIRGLGETNWRKLNDRQKAVLVSLGYNAGAYFLTAKDYGRRIKSHIESGDMDAAAQTIAQGPTRGTKSNKFYPGLKRRRKEESEIFLS